MTRVFRIDPQKGTVAGWCAALRGSGSGVLVNMTAGCPIYPGRSCNSCPAASKENWGSQSRYVVGEVVFQDFDALCETMTALFGEGSLEQSESGDNELEAFGYQGESRTSSIGKVAAVVRRSHIGSASNDLPIRREQDGTYRVIVSDFDKTAIPRKLQDRGFQYWSGCNRDLDQVEARFKTAYAETKVINAAKKKGYTIERSIDDNGQIRLVASIAGKAPVGVSKTSGRYSL